MENQETHENKNMEEKTVQTEKVKIELTEVELQTILNGLAELPAKFSFELIINLQNQYNQQKPNEKQTV